MVKAGKAGKAGQEGPKVKEGTAHLPVKVTVKVEAVSMGISGVKGKAATAGNRDGDSNSTAMCSKLVHSRHMIQQLHYEDHRPISCSASSWGQWCPATHPGKRGGDLPCWGYRC